MRLLETRLSPLKSSNDSIEAGATSEAAIPAFFRRYKAQILAVFSSLVITAAVLAFHRQLAALRSYGYLGVFLISIIGNATVFLPVPSMAVVFAGGSVLNPMLVGLIAGLGEPLGELTGYLAGYGGSAIIQDRRRYEQLQGWMARRGFLTLFVLSAIPNPIFDLAGITAGMLKYPVTKFLIACFLGKTLKSFAVAYVGSLSLPWLLNLLQGR
jgi:membrane protein YqaA with SNARE-associated domain